MMYWVKNNIMGAFEALYQQLEHDDRGMWIWVRGQWDNATLHIDCKLLKVIEEHFGEDGWVWTMQPSNTPLSTILHAAIFQALA